MKHEQIFWIDPRDKPGLLRAVMEEHAVDSRISFEGDLRGLSFYAWADAQHEETPSLKRQTVEPELDFVVLPLTSSTYPRLWKELIERDHLVNEGIIHVQIERDGKLLFGGYDNFHRDCIVAYSGISQDFLEQLRIKGIIRGYQQRSL